MRSPVSLVSTYPDINDAPEMVDEENDDEEEDMDYVEDMDCGGESEDCDDDNAEEDCVDGRIEPNMVDGFQNGEQNRKFVSKVWNEFIKIRVAGVVVKGQCKHCEFIESNPNQDWGR